MYNDKTFRDTRTIWNFKVLPTLLDLILTKWCRIFTLKSKWLLMGGRVNFVTPLSTVWYRTSVATCSRHQLRNHQKRTQTEQQYCSFFCCKVWRVEILKKMLSVIISNFHHVVKFTNAVFNFSSVSLSLETSLATPYTLSFNKENFARFWVKLDLALY